MHDLPEQQPDGEPCVEMIDTIDSIKQTDQITHDGLTFSIIPILSLEQTNCKTFFILRIILYQS